MRRYLAALRPHTPALVLAAVLMTASAAVPGAAVLLLQQSLQQVIGGGSSSRLAALCLGFAGLYVLAGALTYLRTLITKRVSWSLTASLRLQLHRQLLRLSREQSLPTGEKLAALGHDVDELRHGVTALVTAFRAPITLAVLAVVAVSLAPGLAPWALLLVPAAVVPAVWASRRIAELARRQRQARAELLRVAQEQYAGLETIRAFGAQEEAAGRLEQTNQADRAARLQLDTERVLPKALVQASAALGVAVLLWVGGRQVLDGELEPSALVGFAVALGLMNRPLGQLSEVWSLTSRSVAALERAYALVDTEPRPQVCATPQALGESGPCGLQLRGVDVDLGAGPVLRAVDLEVKPGEWLALVGPSGGGKTTLLGLAWRQRDPQAGVVRVDGVDLRHADPVHVARRVAVVRQDDVLFSGSIAENIRLGCPHASPAQVEQAVRLAGAGFVFELQDGLETDVQELGGRLSGGERQRICLARALASPAGLLLLDEATNQVDAATEAAILEALCAVKGSRTIVCVAHDLAVAQHADRVAVVVDGRIVELGAHDQLIDRAGPYAELAAS